MNTTKLRNDLTEHPLKKAIEAIEAGDKEKALIYTKRIWEEGRPLHDLYGDAQASLLTFIATRFGEEFVEEAHRYVGEELWRPFITEMRNKGTAALAEVMASFLRAHGYDFHCEEDEERFRFVLKYCPSGGRMIKEGKEDSSKVSPANFGTTKKRYPWSFNKKGVSYYCCHCALFMDILPREWGWDVFETKIGKRTADETNTKIEPCEMIIYKNSRS